MNTLFTYLVITQLLVFYDMSDEYYYYCYYYYYHYYHYYYDTVGLPLPPPPYQLPLAINIQYIMHRFIVPEQGQLVGEEASVPDLEPIPTLKRPDSARL